jgi:hypothetical protein
MEEEGEVHRKGPVVLCPFGGEEYCCVEDPFGLDVHQQFGAHLVEELTTTRQGKHPKREDSKR